MDERLKRRIVDAVCEEWDRTEGDLDSIGSAIPSVVTLFARWGASVRTTAHIHPATQHVVGEVRTPASPRALTRRPSERGYAGFWIWTPEYSPFPLTGVKIALGAALFSRRRGGPGRAMDHLGE